jgi:pyridoxine 5-phosphate synthase
LIRQLKNSGCRVSLFVDADAIMVEGAAQAGADRIELYTGPYAHRFLQNKEEAVAPYILAAERARALGLGVNAGHDLDLSNLRYLKTTIPWLDEVSIGHALICDALYFGLENTIQMYCRELAD